jgi:hypothetical protein
MNVPYKLEFLSLTGLRRPAYCLWERLATYVKVETLKGSSPGEAPALLPSSVLFWKGLQGTNTLAYFACLNFT